jgi:hypothetical protein
MFIHSDARPNIMPNGDFELYIIYTAGDHFDRLSAALVRRAELQGIPVVQENRAPYKGFYLTDRTAISSEIVQHAVHWMQLRLGASSLPIRPGGHQ